MQLPQNATVSMTYSHVEKKMQSLVLRFIELIKSTVFLFHNI